VKCRHLRDAKGCLCRSKTVNIPRASNIVRTFSVLEIASGNICRDICRNQAITVAQIIKEFNSGTLTLGVDDIGLSAASELTGAEIDSNGVLVSTSEDDGKPVAVGFRAKKANGKYRYFWLYRVKFAVPATNLETKGESINFQTPSIEGTVMRRNKVDGKGRHPWKAEVSEDDSGVNTTTIGNWYKEVYEPAYTAEASNVSEEDA
jgi:phi13 family phage major tail protein